MKKLDMRKIAAIAAVLSVTAGLLTGCAGKAEESSADANATESTTQAAPENEITVRLGLLTGHVLPVIAQENGYFEEEGVKVELIAFNTGAPEIEAYTSGELDIVETGDLPLLNGLSNGVDLQVIGTYSSSDTINALVVRDDAGINDFSDLKGKTVSVAFGTNIQPLLYEYLEAGGLTEDDVEIINLGNADGANALISGDVDAAVVWEPYLSKVAENEGISIFADTSDFRVFVCPISSSSTFLAEHPEETKKVLRALNKASEWSKANAEEASQIVSDYFETDNAEAILIGINKTDSSVPLTEEKVDALLKGASKCYQYGLVENEINLEEYINWDFSEKQ